MSSPGTVAPALNSSMPLGQPATHMQGSPQPSPQSQRQYLLFSLCSVKEMLTTQAERFSKEEVTGPFRHPLYPSYWPHLSRDSLSRLSYIKYP